jgi:hypothetical protein
MDILRNTEKVEMLQGGSVRLRVHILGNVWEFTESELLGPTALEKRLLRLKKAIFVKKDEWSKILQDWFDRSEDIKEISEDDEACEKILIYLSQCTIYKDIDKASAMYTLYYDENDPKIVYSLSDNMARVGESIPWYKAKNNSDGGGLSLQKMGWLISDYIEHPSVQKTCDGKKKRFWRVYIDKANINLDEQMYKEEEDETVLLRQDSTRREGDGHNGDGGSGNERGSGSRSRSKDTQTEKTFDGSDGRDAIFDYGDEKNDEYEDNIEKGDDYKDNTEEEDDYENDYGDGGAYKNTTKAAKDTKVTKDTKSTKAKRPSKTTISATDDLGFKIFCYIKENGSVSNNDIYTAFPDVAQDKINSNIRLMDMQRKILRSSDANGGYEHGGTTIFKIR